MSKIGDGADAGVDKAVNATKRFEAQLKRLNLELESGGRNTAAYIEGRAKMAGADTTALAPLLAQYDQIKAKQALANAEFVKSGKVMTDYGMGVKATSAALRQVPAQFTDIIVSLQGGQAPLTVLLQQGGQLKDVFGGVGNAFKALSGYVFGLINPVTIAIGAVATLGAAYYKGAGEAEAYNKALITTGNAAGVTAGQLSGMAKAVSQATGGTIGAAAEALANIAGTAGIAAGQFERVSAVAVQMQKLTGVAVSETVKQFAELGKEPVKASEKLNETTHYLTAAVYEQIKALEDQGRTLEAGALAQTAYASAMESRIPALTENLGYVQRAWNGITGAAKGAWDAMLNVGRPTADVDVIGALKAKIADTQKNLAYNPKLYGADLKNMQAELVVLERMAASKGAMAAYDADRIKRDEASIKLSKEAEKYASNEVKMAREIAKANADFASSNKSDKDIENYGARLRGIANAYKDIGTAAKAAKAYQVPEYDKLIAAMDKANTQAQQEIATGEALSKSEKYRIDTLYGLVAAYNAKKISATQLAQAESYLDKVTREMASAEQSIAESKALAEAQKAIAKARTDAIQSHAKEIESLNEKAQKLEDEVAMYGMSKEAIEELTTARMLDQIEVLRGFDNSAEEIARIEQVIEARKRLAAAGTAKDNKDAAAKAAKDAAEEWKKASEKIEQDITDALMRGFESGKGFAEVLRDTIENTFKTMVIRPVIQATVQGGLNAVGLGSAQGGGTINGIGGAINTANSMNSIYAAGSQFLYGSSVGASAASLAAGNMAGMVGGDALGTMIAANGSWAGVSAGTAAGTAAAGTAATGAGAASSLAAAGPYVAAAIAAYMIADSLFGSKGGPKSDSSYNMGGFGDASATGLAGTYATGVEDAWKTLAKELEITTALKVGALTSIDTQGDAKTILRANATVDGVGVYDRATRMGTAENVGRSQEELQAAMAEETTRILFAALKASDLPEQYKTYLNTIGDSVADMTEAMTIVAVVDDFNDALQSLPFENLKTLSFEAAKGLIEVAGGMDVLGANLGTYYTNFYSAEEQRLQTIKTINAATAGSGLDAATATRDQFRQIVEAQDLTTESGRATYAALLGVSGAFAGITQSADDLAKAASDAAEKLAEAARKIQEDRLKTNLDLATTAASDAYSAIERAVSAQRDAITSAYESQSERIQASLDSVSESVGKLKSLSDSLKSTLDGMRVAGSDSVYRAAAQAQISAALATARAGGGLPLDGQLESALRTVGQPSEKLFGSFEDYARDFYKTANDISALGDLTGVQLSAEEATQAILKSQLSAMEDGFKSQTKALDDILENAKKQLDAANGLDTSVLSLADALAGFSAAIQALAAERAAQDLPTSGAGADYFTSNPDVKAAYAQNTYGLNAAEYANVHYGLYGKDEGRASPIAPPAATAKSYFELYPDVAAAFKANNYGMDQITYSARHFANFGKAEGRVFPGFAVGTNYVPSDMIAQIHEGEAIVPKAYNPAAGGRDDTAAALRALADRLDRIEANTRATAGHTAGTDRKLARVIPGNAMITEAA